MNKDGQRTTQFHVGEPIGIRIKTVLAEDLYTFIKKIELSNGDGAKALLINNFCRPNEIKTLVFNYAETKHLFDTAGQGRFERFMSKGTVQMGSNTFGPSISKFLDRSLRQMIV